MKSRKQTAESNLHDPMRKELGIDSNAEDKHGWFARCGHFQSETVENTENAPEDKQLQGWRSKSQSTSSESLFKQIPILFHSSTKINNADEEQLHSAENKISTPTALTSHLKFQHRMCFVATILAEGRSRKILQHRQAVYVYNIFVTYKTSRGARRQDEDITTSCSCITTAIKSTLAPSQDSILKLSMYKTSRSRSQHAVNKLVKRSEKSSSSTVSDLQRMSANSRKRAEVSTQADLRRVELCHQFLKKQHCHHLLKNGENFFGILGLAEKEGSLLKEEHNHFFRQADFPENNSKYFYSVMQQSDHSYGNWRQSDTNSVLANMLTKKDLIPRAKLEGSTEVINGHPTASSLEQRRKWTLKS
ncbi:hypothetical protein GCK72_010422 [Caenorhabditis remanei]|uniref:Uncharacterized protein n=1 Tax=Caenorhabditis remanei TaxID=31234 RepID=A0A6A5H2U5_CAERE|nr:hypothetical protein GCK72_010422 [Caenorhabditis remanei]KAF1762160.1 hypothetical protein GCK72_010422 [Caenorhabditis remanei]